MRQDAYGAGETEQTPRERGRKTQLAKDNSRGPIDIHCDLSAALASDFRLNRLTDVGKPPIHRTRLCGLAYQRHQPWCAGIDGLVETVAKARDDFAIFLTPGGDTVVDGSIALSTVIDPFGDIEVKFGALFKGRSQRRISRECMVNSASPHGSYKPPTEVSNVVLGALAT